MLTEELDNVDEDIADGVLTIDVHNHALSFKNTLSNFSNSQLDKRSILSHSPQPQKLSMIGDDNNRLKQPGSKLKTKNHNGRPIAPNSLKRAMPVSFVLPTKTDLKTLLYSSTKVRTTPKIRVNSNLILRQQNNTSRSRNNQPLNRSGGSSSPNSQPSGTRFDFKKALKA